MDDEKIIENMKNVISILNSENEELKRENIELLNKLSFFENKDKDEFNRINGLIAECNSMKNIYDELITETKEIKEQYENSLRDVSFIKKELEEKKKEILKNFKI